MYPVQQAISSALSLWHSPDDSSLGLLAAIQYTHSSNWLKHTMSVYVTQKYPSPTTSKFCICLSSSQFAISKISTNKKLCKYQHVSFCFSCSYTINIIISLWCNLLANVNHYFTSLKVVNRKRLHLVPVRLTITPFVFLYFFDCFGIPFPWHP